MVSRIFTRDGSPPRAHRRVAAMSAGARAGRDCHVGSTAPWSPLDGLAVRLGTLAALVNDALTALGTRPAFAIAGGPSGPLLAASALETPPSPRPVRARASRNLH